MSKQELFEKISDLEEMTFYYNLKVKDEETIKIHDLAKEILENYAKITGCHN